VAHLLFCTYLVILSFDQVVTPDSGTTFFFDMLYCTVGDYDGFSMSTHVLNSIQLSGLCPFMTHRLDTILWFLRHEGDFPLVHDAWKNIMYDQIERGTITMSLIGKSEVTPCTH
jgi:hypothetical protein